MPSSAASLAEPPTVPAVACGGSGTRPGVLSGYVHPSVRGRRRQLCPPDAIVADYLHGLELVLTAHSSRRNRHRSCPTPPVSRSPQLILASEPVVPALASSPVLVLV